MTDEVRIPHLSTSHDASKQRLVSDEKLRLDAAFDRLKEFPEFNPNERVYWLEFRQAYEAYRARWG